KPTAWKDGARMAVALSFDADHETIDLRNGGISAGRMSQGQYGARAGMPRILDVLDRHGVPASVFMPAVSALLHPEEVQRVVGAGHELAIHSWIHESNSGLDHATERDLSFRAADALERLCGTRPVGMRTASWDFSPHTLATRSRQTGSGHSHGVRGSFEAVEALVSICTIRLFRSIRQSVLCASFWTHGALG
ncbi:MAG: hypothetical protein EON55_14515, partial [Alphaproteobacteria bacterium]